MTYNVFGGTLNLAQLSSEHDSTLVSILTVNRYLHNNLYFISLQIDFFCISFSRFIAFLFFIVVVNYIVCS